MKQGIIIAGFTALGKTTLAQKYDIVLTSMHWKLLEYFNKNNIITIINKTAKNRNFVAQQHQKAYAIGCAHTKKWPANSV